MQNNEVRAHQRTIIFDGPDNCGKTNIGLELSKRTCIPYFKNSDEHKYFLSDPTYFVNAIRHVDTYFTSYLEQSASSVILDRAYPSEWVYSQALGRETDMEVLTSLDQRHAAMGTKIVIPIRSSYRGVSDDYEIVNQNIQKIHDLYLEFAKWSRCEVLILNVDDEDIEREIREISEFVSEKNVA
jgi:thymidylate kinase